MADFEYINIYELTILREYSKFMQRYNSIL